MKIAEVLAAETDANDAQLQSIKQQERTLKIRKAQIKARKASANLIKLRNKNI
jgi:hypothetical protein